MDGITPEAQYGAIAGRPRSLPVGDGVRLVPTPYSHSVRTAASSVMLDGIRDGGGDWRTGGSASPCAPALRRGPRVIGALPMDLAGSLQGLHEVEHGGHFFENRSAASGTGQPALKVRVFRSGWGA